MHIGKVYRYLTILVAALYLSWIGANVAHARSVAAGGQPEKHACKNLGDTAHRCRHISGDGKQHVDHSHDGHGRIGNATAWGAIFRQARYAALFGFFQDQSETSVPPECSCVISCFFSGDGLPSPNWPN